MSLSLYFLSHLNFVLLFHSNTIYVQQNVDLGMHCMIVCFFFFFYSTFFFIYLSLFNCYIHHSIYRIFFLFPYLIIIYLFSYRFFFLSICLYIYLFIYCNVSEAVLTFFSKSILSFIKQKCVKLDNNYNMKEKKGQYYINRLLRFLKLKTESRKQTKGMLNLYLTVGESCTIISICETYLRV